MWQHRSCEPQLSPGAANFFFQSLGSREHVHTHTHTHMHHKMGSSLIPGAAHSVSTQIMNTEGVWFVFVRMWLWQVTYPPSVSSSAKSKSWWASMGPPQGVEAMITGNNAKGVKFWNIKSFPLPRRCRRLSQHCLSFGATGHPAFLSPRRETVHLNCRHQKRKLGPWF